MGCEVLWVFDFTGSTPGLPRPSGYAVRPCSEGCRNHGGWQFFLFHSRRFLSLRRTALTERSFLRAFAPPRDSNPFAYREGDAQRVARQRYSELSSPVWSASIVHHFFPHVLAVSTHVPVINLRSWYFIPTPFTYLSRTFAAY